MRYDLIIFDFDGTLADSFPWFGRRLNDLAEHFGFPRISDADAARLRTLPPRQVLRELGIPLWRLPAIARYTQQLMARERNQVPLFPGVPKLLSSLSESGVQLAIVSSNNQLNIASILGDSCAGLIDHFRCGTSIFGKRAKLRQVLRTAGIPPQRALCMGDEIRDLEAARAAKIAFGAVGWGMVPLATLQTYDPDFAFASLDQITAELTTPDLAHAGAQTA